MPQRASPAATTLGRRCNINAFCFLYCKSLWHPTTPTDSREFTLYVDARTPRPARLLKVGNIIQFAAGKATKDFLLVARLSRQVWRNHPRPCPPEPAYNMNSGCGTGWSPFLRERWHLPGRAARGRKVRTPQSSVPDNVREDGQKSVRRKVPQKTYRLRRKPEVRVKRCGKSAPPGQ